MVIDDADAHLARPIGRLGMSVLVTDTIMRSELDRRRLATEVLEFAGALRR
jgi:hypothetical protein